MCKSGKAATIIVSTVFATVVAVLLYFNILMVNQLANEVYGLSTYVQKIHLAPSVENVDFEKLVRANVMIISGQGTGSGTVVSMEDGYIYILTARHVVLSEKVTDRLVVEIPITDKNYSFKDKDYGVARGCKLVDVDKSKDVVICDDYDIAMIRIKDFPGHELSWIPPGKKDPKLGDVIYVVGNPLCVRDIIAKGIYNGSREVNGLQEWIIYAGITFGCSGGAIINAEGEIIGVTFAKLTGMPVSYVGMCVPRKPMLIFACEAFEIFEKENATVTK